MQCSLIALETLESVSDACPQNGTNTLNKLMELHCTARDDIKADISLSPFSTACRMSGDFSNDSSGTVRQWVKPCHAGMGNDLLHIKKNHYTLGIILL